jgi:hypothetical protein
MSSFTTFMKNSEKFEKVVRSLKLLIKRKQVFCILYLWNVSTYWQEYTAPKRWHLLMRINGAKTLASNDEDTRRQNVGIYWWRYTAAKRWYLLTRIHGAKPLVSTVRILGGKTLASTDEDKWHQNVGIYWWGYTALKRWHVLWGYTAPKPTTTTAASISPPWKPQILHTSSFCFSDTSFVPLAL